MSRFFFQPLTFTTYVIYFYVLQILFVYFHFNSSYPTVIFYCFNIVYAFCKAFTSVFERCYTNNPASPNAFFLLSVDVLLCPCHLLSVPLLSLSFSLCALLILPLKLLCLHPVSLSRRPCLFLRVLVCDSLTIILEEIP